MKALYHAAFYTVSAFNNAGFDLSTGTSSLINGIQLTGGTFIEPSSWLYYYANAYLSILSLLGGISFLVIIDIVLGHKPPRLWTSFTKVCLMMTFGLIIVMTGLLFVTDGFKPDDPMMLHEALFQVINCRTAGFSVYPQETISVPGRIICGVMMFIGGSPLSTAGGIKVTTIFVIVLAIISYFRGKRLSAFKRRYSYDLVAKSMSLVFIVVSFLFVAFGLLMLFGTKKGDGNISENIATNKSAFLLYEVFSCFGNVGFQTGLEPYLSVGSRLVLCIVMLVGHLGPMAIFQLFQNNLDKNANVHYSFVEEDFLIG